GVIKEQSLPGFQDSHLSAAQRNAHSRADDSKSALSIAEQ
ncbi:MAG: hypothetical protein QOD00_655, partial [Blastocatellia bacterium]|nr:hypothetical protein [Blastocatellia bacterium]